MPAILFAGVPAVMTPRRRDEFALLACRALFVYIRVVKHRHLAKVWRCVRELVIIMSAPISGYKEIWCAHAVWGTPVWQQFVISDALCVCVKMCGS